jgi:hypothetical protein
MSDEYSDPNVIADMQAGWAADRRELKRLRSELSAAKEAEAAAQLAVRNAEERAVSAILDAPYGPFDQDDDVFQAGWDAATDAFIAAHGKYDPHVGPNAYAAAILEAYFAALPKKPTPTEEKVRRLVVALKKFEDRYGDDNGREDDAWDEVQAALSEVEAFIGKPQQSKGG